MKFADGFQFGLGFIGASILVGAATAVLFGGQIQTFINQRNG